MPVNLNTLSLKEADRLVTGKSTTLLAILEQEKFVFLHGRVRHSVLSQWLIDHGCDSRLLDEPNQTISLAFAQFISLHVIYQQFKPELRTMPQIRQYMSKTFPFKSLMNDWWQRGKLIEYLEYFSITTWSALALTQTKQPGEIHLLEGSLANCAITTDELFDFIYQVNTIINYHGGLYNTGEQLSLKLKNDLGFAQLLFQEMPRIMQDDVLRQLLPGIMKGLINGSDVLFHQHAESLLADYEAEYAAELLIALAVASPDDAGCRTALIGKLRTYHEKNIITSAIYIYALNVGKFNDEGVRQELTAMAKQEQTLETAIQLLSYLQAYLKDSQEIWFREIATALVILPESQLTGMLQLLLNLLTEYNVPLIYELMTSRFTAIGSQHFINDHWYTLVQKDKPAFHRQLTFWFNSGERNVHKALLMLTSVRDLEDTDFTLSETELAKLSEGDKLYIGIKIAGFIYTKEPLQNLMFSLIGSFKANEQALMQEVFNIMYNYVIYNYRSVLDAVKVQAKATGVPRHLKQFYSSLDYHFEQYFEQLRTVRDFPELRPDRKLAEHLRFYSQQKFTEEFKKSPRPAWADFGKSVTIHSHRWAIRRSGQPKHQPSPLNSIETSAEFPSGERLNPIFQETLRRTYQKMKRHEINLD